MLRLLCLSLGISFLSSCGPNRPALTFCFFSSQQVMMKCTDPKGKEYDCDTDCMDGFFGMPKQDAEKLLEYVTDLEKKAVK